MHLELAAEPVESPRRWPHWLVGTLVLALLAVAAVPTARWVSVQPQVYVRIAIAAAYIASMKRNEVDWPTLRAEVLEKARGAQTAAETHPAIRHLVRGLEDGHSLLLSTTQATALAQKPMWPSGRMLDARTGYLDLPRCLLGQTEYSEKLRAIVDELAVQGATRWIVDLRRNEGGDVHPMIRGLRALLGEDTMGYNLRPDSGKTAWWDRFVEPLSNGMFLSAGTRIAWQHVGGAPTNSYATHPVAVLTSGRTASSAERVVISFRGMDRARSLGEPTGGFTTSNLGIPLPDGSSLHIADAVSMDRTGRRYDGPIAPDETVAIEWAELGTDADPVLRAALRWLNAWTAA